MFTIRCEYHSLIPSNDYFMTQTESYDVRDIMTEFGVCSAQTDIIKYDGLYRQKQITLRNEETIFIGQGTEFSRAFVMNDRGKTIDTIEVL
jgi:hypothetical protein